jgi:alpha-galactosidase
MIMRLCVVIILLLGATAARAVSPSPGELANAKQWVEKNFLTDRAHGPFSFVYDGKRSAEFLHEWKRNVETHQLDEQRRERTLTWTDAATGLQVRCTGVEYADFPVVEWTVYLKNAGKQKTAILENIQGLDAGFERMAEGEFVLHGNRGDSCVAESYRLFEFTLGPDARKRFSPPVTANDVSGKSCDGPDGWPYFNLQKPGGGLIIAVGWPGQWAASFVRDHDRGLRVAAGQQLTHLYLNPGEEVRTPLIALLFWEGADVVRAQNLWRRWYLAHVLPRIDGQPQPPVASIQVEGSMASLPRVEKFLEAGITPNVCWRDAGGRGTWYPSSGGPYTDDRVWLNTGTWEPDPTRYPNGFRPFSDKVRSLGMQFLLWFEPERVGDPNSWLGKNHPEWLLPGNSAGSLLNEGNPEARRWLVDHVDGMIKSQGLDWYREDMNGGKYGTAWRKNDSEDRRGFTENVYVQGHLAFWDELKRRHPNLRIDSCASGGRRNDLETMRRAVPLLRSDFQHPKMQGVIEGNQGHTYGISSWLPWNGSGVYYIDSYAVRSFLLPGFGVVPPGNWAESGPARASIKKAYYEFERIAPLMLGDYYPLTPYSLQADQWIAWQFNRPEHGDGVVQGFRRAEAKEETLTVKLRDLAPEARYEVENLDGGEETRSGRELMEGFTIALKATPTAALFTYRKK